MEISGSGPKIGLAQEARLPTGLGAPLWNPAFLLVVLVWATLRIWLLWAGGRSRTLRSRPPMPSWALTGDNGPCGSESEVGCGLYCA